MWLDFSAMELRARDLKWPRLSSPLREIRSKALQQQVYRDEGVALTGTHSWGMLVQITGYVP